MPFNSSLPFKIADFDHSHASRFTIGGQERHSGVRRGARLIAGHGRLTGATVQAAGNIPLCFPLSDLR
jgi:hypothetical protein